MQFKKARKDLFFLLIPLSSLWSISFISRQGLADHPIVLDKVTVEAKPLVTEAPRPGRRVISAEQMDQSTAKNLGEVLQSEAGLQVLRSGPPGQTSSVFVRGSQSEQMLVLIDNVPINDPSTTGRLFDFSSMALDNIESIEVYMGPQSTRFGPGAMGGVIYILTKKGAETLNVRYKLEGGSYDTWSGAGSVADSTGTWRYSLGTSIFSTQGFSVADQSQGNQEADGMDSVSLSSYLGVDLSESTEVGATVRYLERSLDLDPRGGPGGDDPNYRHMSQQGIYGLNLGSYLLGSRFYTQTGVAHTRNRRFYRNLPDMESSEDYYEDFSGRGDYLYSRNTYWFTHFASLELGLNYQKEQSESAQMWNGSHSSQPRGQLETQGSYLIYAQEWNKWNLEVGIRYDQFKVRGQERKEAVNHSFLVEYNLFSETKLSAAQRTGFKTPSLFQLYSSYGFLGLESERSKGSEFSVSQGLSPEFSLSLTYFENNYDDLIDFDLALSRYQNIGQAKTQGWEMAGRLESEKKTRLDWSYTYLETQNVVTRETLLRQPRHFLSLRASYPWRDWEWDAFWRYLGQREDLDPVSFSRITMKEHSVLDMQVKYHWHPGLQSFLRIDNVFNKNYQEVAGYGTSGLAAYVGLSGQLH